MRTALLLSVLSLVGCAERAGPSGGIRVNDTATVHNVDASRVWVVQTGADGHQRVVMCDITMLKETRQLCVAWP